MRSLFFKLPKQENRPAEKRGSSLRLITFPFCPAALAHFIQQTDLPDQWSQNASYKKKKKEKEEWHCFRIKGANPVQMKSWRLC